MATETVPGDVPGATELTISTNTSGEIHFCSSEEVAHFARIMSERVSETLQVLLDAYGKADDNLFRTALEGVLDCAFQAKQAVDLLLTVPSSEEAAA